MWEREQESHVSRPYKLNKYFQYGACQGQGLLRGSSNGLNFKPVKVRNF